MATEPDYRDRTFDAESGAIVLDDRYDLLPGSPLPELDLPGTPAVVARDQRNPRDMLFARICAPDTIPRIAVMEQLRHMHETNILRPLEWGPVQWTDGDRQRYAVIFPRPDNRPLMPSHDAKIKPMTSEDISQRILDPVTATLGYFAQRGVTHRAIRPDNIYFAGESRNAVILGDCVTAAPAAHQPTVFETIEMSMTPAVARGSGTAADDFYALGATLLLLSMGENPVKGLSERDLNAAKISKGSYSALMGGRRPPFGLRELLRGLLSDDPADRWGIEELEQWLGGSLRRSVQQYQIRTAERPFEFNGTELGNCRVVARAFGENWEEACKAIRSPEFDKWLRQSTTDPTIPERMAAAVQTDADSGSQTRPSGRLAARAGMILDPSAPVRYKGLTFMPPGLGTALAYALHTNDKDRVKLISECIQTGIPLDWIALQPANVRFLFEKDSKVLKQAQQLLRHTTPGFGVERVLYLLNPNLQCLSPVLAGRYVVSLRALLPTLEQIVVDDGKLPALLDRHLTAFIATRFRKNIDRLLSALEERKGDALASKLGMLTILARIQAEYGPDSLPYLNQWLASELEPAIRRYNSKTRRGQLADRLDGVAQGGALAELNKIVNNENLSKRDEGERRIAMRELTAATREIAVLQSSEFQISARRTGWQIAAGISFTVACAAIAVVGIW